MRKRKINQNYLREITSTKTQNERIDTLSFALSIKEFVNEYLDGLVNVQITGDRRGNVNLNLPVTSYLIRLIAMITDDDEPIDIKITIDDNLTVESRFHALTDVVGVAHIVQIARLAGFSVDRDNNTLFFTAKIQATHIIQIYATSNEEFKNLLITTHLM